MLSEQMMRDLASEISGALSACAAWTLARPRGEPSSVVLSLITGGVVSENPAGISRWAVKFDEKLRLIVLELWLDSKVLYARMSLCPRRCIWFGRCRDGHTSLSPPIPDEPTWISYSHPERLLNEREHPKSASPGLNPATQINFSDACLDVKDLVDNDPRISLRGDGSNAIAIAACGRPDYFERVVPSIAANRESAEWPVFVFIDKPERESDVAAVEAQAEFALTLLPHSVIVRRPINIGCGRNLIDIRRQLFDRLGFDRVWVFEDDLVISATYISLVSRLLDWGLDHYDNVGVAQGWNFAIMGDAERARLVRSAEITFDNWWGYCQTRASWNASKDLMYRYEDLFLGCAYINRPHQSIVEWLRLQLTLAESPSFGRACSDAAALLRHSKYWNAPPTGQDAASMFSLRAAGFIRLATTVTRGTYIGERGIHMNPTWYDRHGFSRCTMANFQEDRGSLWPFNLIDAMSTEVESAEAEVPGLGNFPGLRYVRFDGG